MKKYQKPSLEIVNFEMNEAIAACTTLLSPELEAWYESFGINFTGDGDCETPTYDYCVQTSVSTETSALLMNS